MVNYFLSLNIYRSPHTGTEPDRQLCDGLIYLFPISLYLKYQYLKRKRKCKQTTHSQDQGGEGRVSKAENLRSSSAIQSIFNLLGRTGKIIIFIIQVGI